MFELAGEVFCFRLEQTDTGATARHATTHATEGGGGVDLLHLVIEGKGGESGCQGDGGVKRKGRLVLVGGGRVDVVDDDEIDGGLGGF